jgi:L-ribulokinase
MEAMGQGFDAEYHPDLNRVAYYQKRYDQYKKLGEFVEKETSRQAVVYSL